jgi:hypothetical protein
MALHDLLVSSYGLTSTKNVTLIESLTMFLWIVGGGGGGLNHIRKLKTILNGQHGQFTSSLWKY